MTTDPIADMLTRIRNACVRGNEEVVIPYSKHLLSILTLLKNTGYVSEVEEKGEAALKRIVVVPAYIRDGVSKIQGSKRLSRPSKRVYKKATELRKVKGGQGILVLSTPKGVVTGEAAREQKIGGEALFEIW